MNTSIEVWETVHNWLSLCGFKISYNYCKEEISTHPDYPALTSVIDFLDSGNMDYKAVEADASYINEFNYPLLAHIRQTGQEYMYLVADAAVWNNQKVITDHWTGIVLYTEKNAHWQSELHKIYHNNEFKNKISSTFLVLIGAILFIISIFQLPNLTINSFGFLSILGLIVSLFLLGTELGFQNQIVKQVCGAVSNGGCEKVLRSQYAKGFAGVTPADVSVLYFASQFIVYLLGCWFPSLIISILILAFIGIIISAWSIFTQALKLKQWCALCLSIVAALILQSISAIFIVQKSILNSLINDLNSIYFSFGVFAFLFFVLALILFPVKQLIKVNSNNKLKLAEFKKWKLDADLFLSQLMQEQEVDTTIWENDLLLGNPNAPLLITVACNPYCGPCAKAHKKLDELLHNYPNIIKIQIRLLCNVDNNTDKRTLAVNAILQKAKILQKNTDLQEMLSDWFDSMDIEKWSKKWQLDNTIDISERLQQHNNWIKKSSIAFTPSFFINGKKLNGRYSLNDVKNLIPQLADLMMNKKYANN